MKKEIKSTNGDTTGSIDDLISWLEVAKSEGATHYSMEWSGDQLWSFKWFKTYKFKSTEDIKQEKIDKLKKELKELEG